MPSTICDVCAKKAARFRRVTRAYGEGKTEFLTRGVAIVSCRHCGESYLTAETLCELERIKLHRRQLGVKQPVAVAQFGGAA